MAKAVVPTQPYLVSLEIEIVAASADDAAQGFFEGLRPQFPCIVEVVDDDLTSLGFYEVEFDDDGNVKQSPPADEGASSL